MKLTNEQLRIIINEELAAVMTESEDKIMELLTKGVKALKTQTDKDLTIEPLVPDAFIEFLYNKLLENAPRPTETSKAKEYDAIVKEFSERLDVVDEKIQIMYSAMEGVWKQKPQSSFEAILKLYEDEKLSKADSERNVAKAAIRVISSINIAKNFLINNLAGSGSP